MLLPLLRENHKNDDSNYNEQDYDYNSCHYNDGCCSCSVTLGSVSGHCTAAAAYWYGSHSVNLGSVGGHCTAAAAYWYGSHSVNLGSVGGHCTAAAAYWYGSHSVNLGSVGGHCADYFNYSITLEGIGGLYGAGDCGRQSTTLAARCGGKTHTMTCHISTSSLI